MHIFKKAYRKKKKKDEDYIGSGIKIIFKKIKKKSFENCYIYLHSFRFDHDNYFYKNWELENYYKNIKEQQSLVL